ncbi:MAG TPA: TIM barrel protein [Fimbriiglobus sp.]
MANPSRRTFLTAAAATPIVAGLTPHQTQAYGLHADAKPKFHCGLVTYNVAKDWDLKTILDVCKKAGIPGVELRTTHKHGVEPSLSADQRMVVKGKFADSGIQFFSCGSACEFQSEDPAKVKKNIEETKQFLGLVKDLGGHGVKVRPNGIAKGYTVDRACHQIGQALIECGKAAEDLGLEIFVEVHGGTTQIPKNMKKIMDACGHKAVGVCWNSNPTDVVKGSIAESFDLLAPHIKSCHINELYKDETGKYPYRELFHKLASIGFDRYTFCEVGKSFDPAAGVEVLRYYKALWKELAGA